MLTNLVNMWVVDSLTIMFVGSCVAISELLVRKHWFAAAILTAAVASAITLA